MVVVTEHLEQEVSRFLIKEAELLDNHAYEEWLSLLTPDVRYIVPVQVTQEQGVPSRPTSGMAHLDEDYTSLEMRVRRLKSARAWAENPPSRTRHFVTNVRVEPGDREGELKVRSNVLLWRSRGDEPHADLLSAERHDLLRRVEGQWKIAQRVVILDQAVVNTRSLSVIL
ncbi:Biphenyl dioxygenase subunit beta [bacterium HR10]|nr:Biphenyl dioxygenase subunit beta [bacterium HR10]